MTADARRLSSRRATAHADADDDFSPFIFISAPKAMMSHHELKTMKFTEYAAIAGVYIAIYLAKAPIGRHLMNAIRLLPPRRADAFARPTPLCFACLRMPRAYHGIRSRSPRRQHHAQQVSPFSLSAIPHALIDEIKPIDYIEVETMLQYQATRLCRHQIRRHDMHANRGRYGKF